MKPVGVGVGVGVGVLLVLLLEQDVKSKAIKSNAHVAIEESFFIVLFFRNMCFY